MYNYEALLRLNNFSVVTLLLMVQKIFLQISYVDLFRFMESVF